MPMLRRAAWIKWLPPMAVASPSPGDDHDHLTFRVGQLDAGGKGQRAAVGGVQGVEIEVGMRPEQPMPLPPNRASLPLRTPPTCHCHSGHKSWSSPTPPRARYHLRHQKVDHRRAAPVHVVGGIAGMNGVVSSTTKCRDALIGVVREMIVSLSAFVDNFADGRTLESQCRFGRSGR